MRLVSTPVPAWKDLVCEWGRMVDTRGRKPQRRDVQGTHRKP